MGTACDGQADGHGRVEVAARDGADGVDHHHHGDAERHGHAEEVDALVAGVENGRAAAGEHEHEGPEELRAETARQRNFHAPSLAISGRGASSSQSESATECVQCAMSGSSTADEPSCTW